MIYTRQRRKPETPSQGPKPETRSLRHKVKETNQRHEVKDRSQRPKLETRSLRQSQRNKPKTRSHGKFQGVSGDLNFNKGIQLLAISVGFLSGPTICMVISVGISKFQMGIMMGISVLKKGISGFQ